jgi:cell division septal protein FtsQ
VTLRTRVIAISVILFAGLVYLFAWSPVFTVRAIEMAGLPQTISAKSIITRSHLSIGSKLSRIEPRSSERALREISWVSDVSISRNWLNGKVTVAITPRVPVGLYNGKAIDRDGVIFELPGATPAGLPTVSAVTPDLGLVAISLFTSLPADLRDSLTSISAASESSITSWQLWNGRGLKVMWGSQKQIDLKVTVLKALLLLPENKNVTRVDLSAPHAPIVK